MRQRREPDVGIVLPEQDAVFRPRGEHPVGFIDPFRNEVVDQDTDVRLVPAQDKGLLSAQLPVGVDTRHNPLRRGFLITRGSIDLARQEEVFDAARLQRRTQQGGIEIVVFDGVGRAEDLDVLQPLDGMEGLQLHVQRQRGGESLQVVFVGPPAFRLQEKLMGVVVRKHPELVFDARTITRAAPVNHAGEQRRLVKAGPQDFVDAFVGVQDETIHLRLPLPLDGRRFRQKREAGRIRIAGLDGKLRCVDGRNVDARRGPRLHPVGDKSAFDELFRQSVRRRLADPPSLHLVTADEEFARKEGSGGQNNRLRPKNRTGICLDAADF